MGQDEGADTNISFNNTTRLKNSSETLRYITLNACFTGANSNGIAARLSRQLNVTVNAFTGATIFSSDPYKITTRGKLPNTGPAYLIADGGEWRTFSR